MHGSSESLPAYQTRSKSISPPRYYVGGTGEERTAIISAKDGRQQGMLELAQCMMLKALNACSPLHDQDNSTLIHQCVFSACRSRSQDDARIGQVSWSRHLLAFLRTQLDLTKVVSQSVTVRPL